MIYDLKRRLFLVSQENFELLSLDVFNFQAQNNLVYKKYLELLRIEPSTITCVDNIPFLPISFFKTHKVLVEGFEPEIIFSSSGTSGEQTSRHYVASIDLYMESFTKGFELFYGNASQYCILALLPSYLERQGSSLVYMANRLISNSIYSQSGFFLSNTDELVKVLIDLNQRDISTILLGVSFALLELAKCQSMELPNTIIMETGGMKGRGKELVRRELHSILQKSFGPKSIHSEYGMTELLSQAYSKGNGVFACPPWMSVRIRDPYDPFSFMPAERIGAINIIDLANLFSCSFLQTDDLGLIKPDKTFEVIGRLDGSQIRGCNMLE